MRRFPIKSYIVPFFLEGNYQDQVFEKPELFFWVRNLYLVKKSQFTWNATKVSSLYILLWIQIKEVAVEYLNIFYASQQLVTASNLDKWIFFWHFALKKMFTKMYIFHTHTNASCIFCIKQSPMNNISIVLSML